VEKILVPERRPEGATVEKAEAEGGEAHHSLRDVEVSAKDPLLDAATEDAMQGFELGCSHVDQRPAGEAAIVQGLPPEQPNERGVVGEELEVGLPPNRAGGTRAHGSPQAGVMRACPLDTGIPQPNQRESLRHHARFRVCLGEFARRPGGRR
jgi:hypothetical protein